MVAGRWEVEGMTVTDRVILQKLGAAFTPAQKITRIKRDHRDANKRRFQEKPRDEAENNSSDAIHLDVNSATSEEKEGQTGGTPLKSKKKPHAAGKEKVAEHGRDLGSVLDIHV